MPAQLDRDLWHPTTLEGRLVVLRHFRPEQLGSVIRWYRDADLARLTRYQQRPMSQDEIEHFFRGRLLAADALAYAIHVRNGERLVGLTTFSALDPDNGSALFHITIGERDAWGRGYGTETAELMLEHAFVNLGLHRIGLSVFAFNERALRSYEKAGFAVEGRLREAIYRDGRWWDEVQMGVLAHEWLDRRALRAADSPAVRAATSVMPVRSV